MARPELEAKGAQLGAWLLAVLASGAGLAACGAGQRDQPQQDRPSAGTATRPATRPSVATPPKAGAPRSVRAVVALERENAIAVIAGPPWRVLRRFPAPAGPHNTAVSRDGRVAAVSSPPADRVTLLDLVRLRVLARARVSGAPHDVDFTADGRFVWVTAEQASRVVRLSVPAGGITASRRASGRPHDLAVSPDGRRLWVTIDGSSALDVRDAASGRLVRRAAIGLAPHDVAFEPGGARLWLSNWSSPLLTVVSARTGRPLKTLRGGTEPHHFAFGAGCLWASDHGGGAVARIDPISRTVRGRTTVGPEPHHVAVARGQALVAVHGTGTVAVVSPTGRLQGRIAVGAGPHGIATVEEHDPRSAGRCP